MFHRNRMECFMRWLVTHANKKVVIDTMHILL
jgi:hypothetical protein